MPYYGVKDAFSIILVLFVFFIFVVWCPDKLGHSDNFILANSLVTPAHIVPEWYFLPLYAILRSVTNKLLGISLIACAIVCILLVPFFCKGFIIRSTAYRPYYGFLIWIFFMICLSLGWIGSLPVIMPYFEIGLYTTILYFVYFIFIFPLLGAFEKLVYDYILVVLWKKKISLVFQVLVHLVLLFHSMFIKIERLVLLKLY